MAPQGSGEVGHQVGVSELAARSCPAPVASPAKLLKPTVVHVRRQRRNFPVSEEVLVGQQALLSAR